MRQNPKEYRNFAVGYSSGYTPAVPGLTIYLKNYRLPISHPCLLCKQSYKK